MMVDFVLVIVEFKGDERGQGGWGCRLVEECHYLNYYLVMHEIIIIHYNSDIKSYNS